jgi:hypothetical protein
MSDTFGGVISLLLFGPERTSQKLCRQLFAALGAAGCQHKTATLGCHTSAKAVTAGANQVRRLKSALHRGLHQTGVDPVDSTRKLEARPLGGEWR